MTPTLRNVMLIETEHERHLTAAVSWYQHRSRPSPCPALDRAQRCDPAKPSRDVSCNCEVYQLGAC